jgi:hypothetical protein
LSTLTSAKAREIERGEFKATSQAIQVNEEKIHGSPENKHYDASFMGSSVMNKRNSKSVMNFDFPSVLEARRERLKKEVNLMQIQTRIAILKNEEHKAMKEIEVHAKKQIQK